MLYVYKVMFSSVESMMPHALCSFRRFYIACIHVCRSRQDPIASTNNQLVFVSLLNSLDAEPSVEPFSLLIAESSDGPCENQESLSEPLSEWAVSIPTIPRIPHSSQHRLNDGHAGDSHSVELHTEPAAHQHPNPHPAPPPTFVNNIFGMPGILALPPNFVHETGFVFRTWYVHHEFIQRWNAPRFVEVNAHWDGWSREILRSWREMIIANGDISLHTVLPDPPRHYITRHRVIADVIVSQGIGRSSCLLTVDGIGIDLSPRGSFALALSPDRVVGMDSAHVADLDSICTHHQRTFSAGWDRIPLEEGPLFLTRDGQGLQLHIQPRISTVDISQPESSDTVNFVFVQLSVTSCQPLQHNDPEAPDWYYGHNEPPAHAARHLEDDQEAADQDHQESPDDDESGPSDDPDIHPPDDDVNRQAVLLFHMDEAPIHVMLLWVDWPRMIREVAYHFGVVRENIIDCHELQILRPDIPDGVVPLIAQQVRDIPVGAVYVLILVDLEIHGHPVEMHYHTAPQVERKVISVPHHLSRSLLLAQAGISDFCRFIHDGCLVEYNKHPWYLQDTNQIHAAFGDYARIQVSPSRRYAVPTGDLIADSRDLPPGNFNEIYGTLFSSSDEEAHSEVSNVSPSLIDSEDIREEYGHHRNQMDDSSDEVGVMQTLAVSASSSSSAAQGPLPKAPPANQSAQDLTHSCTALFDPCDRSTWPYWFHRAQTLFGDNFEIEDIEEGPVLYVTTWFVSCHEESTNE